ncbi:MAG: hypothetical protein AAF657_04480 [Acidobacteriota bacterium]
MSLKAIHIFFVTVATLISGGFGAWAVQRYLTTGSAGDLVLTVLTLAMTLALPVYGVWFLKKMKKVGYV